MRKFIVSDLHGNGNIYKIIMSFLENVNLNEKVILYINGDLIDRGPDSVDMLLDLRDRISKKQFEIVYLGGNHELMMYQIFQKRIMGLNTYKDIWFSNGGLSTDKQLNEKLVNKEQILELVDFIGNLNIYNKFEEKINNKNIVLVHASCPLNVEDECNLKIKDDNANVELAVWTRQYDPFIPFRCRIGNKDYFSIVGHTPNESNYGFEYHKDENFLNIDGGSSYYVSGLTNYDNIPLVEVQNGYLKILTFNNNNEIVFGNYFINNNVVPFKDIELESERKYLNKNLKSKKLTLDSNEK